MPVPDPPHLRTVRLSIRTEPEDTWDPHMVAVNMTHVVARTAPTRVQVARACRGVTGGSSATRRDHRDDWQH